MENQVKPKHDYLLVKAIEDDTGVIKTEDIRDRKPKGEVLAVGPGIWQHGVFVKTTTKVGEIVYFEEAAEANTPEELKKQDLYLIKEARVIAEYVEAKDAGK